MFTKYRVSSERVASKVEHMGVVSSNYSQRIMDAGHEICTADGPVHLHSFMQSLLGLPLVVSMVNTSPCKREREKKKHIGYVLHMLCLTMTADVYARQNGHSVPSEE